MGWTDKDLKELHHMARLDDAQDAMAFITALHKAFLDDPHSHLPDNAIYRLQHPPQELPDATNPDFIQLLNGVVPIVHDMCPFTHLDQCHRCGEDHWDMKKSTDCKKVARQRYDTFPVGPQLQALWHYPDQAQKMCWCEDQTKKIFEELKGTGGVASIYEDILHGKKYLDACQSGKIKDSDSVIFNHTLEERYKKKSKKPKNLDLFMFSGLHHLCAIQTEGLLIWDSVKDILFQSNPFLFIVTADGPGMAFLMGLIGHHGKMGCRLYCGLPRGAPTYYSTLLQPDLHRITKSSIFCGFNNQCILLVPHCFGSNIMHITAINAGDTLIPHWHGTFRADPDDDKYMWLWTHGSTIADTTPFLPGSFDRPPHNPTEKINSRFKAWEWLLYLYGMGLAALFSVLPDPYWTNFCHLVNLIKAHKHLLMFAHDFETIYYQCCIDCLHFVCPWIHLTTHIPSETIAKGPPICSSQWMMECTIGNLAQEIHLHNSSINAIKAIIQSIEPEQNSLLKGSQDLRNGYVLLHQREWTAHPVCLCKAGAILHYLSTCRIDAHLCLPNGQITHSARKENAMSWQPHIAHNVKMSIAEVLFYFNMTIHDEAKTFARVSQFSPPHTELLHCLFQTVVACHYCGDTSLKLIEVSAIQSVVAMPGLDIIQMGGIEDIVADED
ncbi:hypothetical protein DFH29DRAFT_984874 [Suillus ampliporus]|nr:hypothetical protein DFH29DRAFT_984874 [Suillus ampliporus]